MAPSVLSCVLLITVTMASFVSSQSGGFTVDLIHRDASLPPSERIANAVRRSVNRVHRFNPTSSSSVRPNQVESTLTMDDGAYLMDISIGTPPFPIKAIADTGSDLVWTQCKPCPGCYKQTDPLFDPKKSSTFKTLPCTSSLCRNSQGFCTESSSSCQYAVQYGDGSHSNGVVAAETLTLDSSTGRAVAFPKTVIGCGFDNNGTFKEDGSGIIGLGGGPESLISQLESSINGKFSHCLVPIWSEKITTSKMSFGSNAVVSGPGAASTPIVRDTENPTFYFLTLKSISVGNKTKIPFPGIAESPEGNIIIDSGTTLTVLPPDMVEDLNAAVEEAIDSRYEVKEGEGPFSLCYENSKSEEFEAPILTLHFAGGADVKLDTLHSFVQINDDTVCLSLVASPGLNRAIYGNLHQMNYLVGYDVKKDTVSFKPADCTKYQ